MRMLQRQRCRRRQKLSSIHLPTQMAMVPRNQGHLQNLTQRVRPQKKHSRRCMIPWFPFQGKKVGRTLMMIVMTTDQEGEAVPRTNKGRSLLTRAQRRQALSSRKMIVSSWLFLHVIPSLGWFVSERWSNKSKTKRILKRQSEGFALRILSGLFPQVPSHSCFVPPRVKSLANKARDASQTLHSLDGNEARYLGSEAVWSSWFAHSPLTFR